ncbi:hypothetical protein N0V90_009288 [Kalmusia sp. IMI 367209]|nr:hypothetical protein N0V90_009288 [Kalmusia sp. IMI 367209]
MADMTEPSSKPSGHARGYSRDYTFGVNFDTDQIEQLAQEIKDGTVHETVLSLFIWWICEKPENFEEAKKHIRELGLDQSYQTSRITNDKLRKLLEDVAELRPMYEPPIPEEDEGEESLLEMLRESAIEPKQLHSARSPGMSLRSPFRQISLGRKVSATSLLRARSQGTFHKSPLRPPKADSLMFESQISSPLTSPLTSPLQPRPAPPKVASLSGLKKQKSLSAASVSQSSHATDKNYPPDTPDRPAPLNVKPRSASTPNTAVFSSMSTPGRGRAVSPLPPQDGSPPPPMPSLPFSLSTDPPKTAPKLGLFPGPYRKQRKGGHRRGKIADVFPVVARDDTERSGFSDAVASEAINAATTNVETSVQSPVYTLAPSELASDSGSEYPDSVPSLAAEYNEDEEVQKYAREYRSVTKTEVGIAAQSHSIADNDGAEWWTDGEQDDEQVNLGRDSDLKGESEPSSTASSSDIQKEPSPRFSRLSEQVRSSKGRTMPAPTVAQRRAASQARKEAQEANRMAMSGFYRPLPLRSFESDTFNFPVLKNSTEGRNRSASLSRDESSILNLYSELGGLEAAEGNEGEAETHSEGYQETVINIGHTQSPRDRNTSAETAHALPYGIIDLVQFPTVPSSNAQPSPTTLADAYRSITGAVIRQSLQRTRARGMHLPILELDTLSSSSLAWRTTNEELLVGIYGRDDVELTMADVRFVNRIGRELREGVGQVQGYEWVGELFRRTH